MRFMMLVKANKDSEAGVLPTKELVSAMGKFNEEMIAAGVMLAGEGLHASSKGFRVKYAGDARTGRDSDLTKRTRPGCATPTSTRPTTIGQPGPCPLSGPGR